MGLTIISEFLIHAADVEGLCQGIDEALVQSKWWLACVENSRLDKMSRARGMGNDPNDVCWRRERWGDNLNIYIRLNLNDGRIDIGDLSVVDRLSEGRVDLTYGRYTVSAGISK